MIDPVALQDAGGDSAAEPARQHGQLAGQRQRARRLLELLAARRREHHRQLEGVRPLRPVQGQPLSAESDRRRVLSALGQQPLRHEHRRRLGLGDVEQDHAERARQLLQHDRRVLQPVAAARRRRPAGLLVAARGTRRSTTAATSTIPRSTSRPAPGTDTTNRLGRQGREWYPASGCVDGVGAHEPLPGPPQHEVGRREFAPTTAKRRASSRSIWCSTRRSPPTAPTAPTSSDTGNQWATLPAGRARQPDVGPAGAAAESRPARLRRVLPGRLHASAIG